jgi:hypothetical protein
MDDFDLLYYDQVGDMILISDISVIVGTVPLGKMRFIVRPSQTKLDKAPQPVSSATTTTTTEATTSSPLFSMDGFTAFAQCLQNALDQIQKDITPLQQLAQQQATLEVSDKTLGAVDNILRATAEAAVTIHRTTSSLLKRPASKPVHVSSYNPVTTPIMYCDTCYQIIEG